MAWITNFDEFLYKCKLGDEQLAVSYGEYARSSVV